MPNVQIGNVLVSACNLRVESDRQTRILNFVPQAGDCFSPVSVEVGNLERLYRTFGSVEGFAAQGWVSFDVKCDIHGTFSRFWAEVHFFDACAVLVTNESDVIGELPLELFQVDACLVSP